MELRFIERLEIISDDDGIQIGKRVRILQFRTQEAPWWQDVPLVTETGTELATGKAE